MAAVLEGDTGYVTGDFPTGGAEDGSVSGLIRDVAYSSSSTGALVDGAPTGAPAPCAAVTLSGYSVPDLASGQSANLEKPVSNGKGLVTATCSYGTARLGTETASCDTDYVPSSPAPSCVQDTCTGTLPAHAVANGTPGTAAWAYSATA